MERDEEPGDNVMHRGAELRGGGEEGEEKQKQRRRGRGGMLDEEEEEEKARGRAEGVCIWHWEAGKDSVGQAGRTCVFVFD